MNTNSRHFAWGTNAPGRTLLNSPPSRKNGVSRWPPFCCARESPLVCLPLSVANGDVYPSLGYRLKRLWRLTAG